MSQSEVSGALASGGHFRATSYLLEIRDAAGTVVATFDMNDIRGVHRNGQNVIVNRANDSNVTITAASLDDAGRLEERIRSAIGPVAATSGSAKGGGFGKVLKWGCLGTLGLIGLIVIVAVVAALGGDDSDADAEDASGAAAEVTATQSSSGDSDTTDEAETPADSDADASTEPAEDMDEPTATSEPEPEGAVGSGRSNPLPLGETGQTEEWEFQVLEVVRGDEAFNRLVEANQFNDPAPEGYEYVLVNARVKYIGDSNEAQEVDRFWFRSTGDARIKHARPSVVLPEPELRASLFPDGEATGWVAVLAQQGETNLLGIFEPLFSFDDGDEIFFALEEGANVQMLTDRVAEENDAGFDRMDPIPLGERAVGDTWEVWIIESVRGDEALARVKDANQFNEDPQPGMEYVLARVGVRNVKPDSGSDSINDFSFKLTGDAGRVYDNPSVVNPEPDLNFDVYAGGEVEGWITLQSAEGEQNLKVVYEPPFSFRADPRYFALE